MPTVIVSIKKHAEEPTTVVAKKCGGEQSNSPVRDLCAPVRFGSLLPAVNRISIDTRNHRAGRCNKIGFASERRDRKDFKWPAKIEDFDMIENQNGDVTWHDMSRKTDAQRREFGVRDCGMGTNDGFLTRLGRTQFVLRKSLSLLY